MPRGGNHSDAHGDLVKFVTDYLWARGGWCVKIWGGPFQRPGLPDVLAVLAGRFVAVEVKTGAAILDERQTEERRKLERAGALFVECRAPEDLEDALVEAGVVEGRAMMRYGGS